MVHYVNWSGTFSSMICQINGCSHFLCLFLTHLKKIIANCNLCDIYIEIILLLHISDVKEEYDFNVYVMITWLTWILGPAKRLLNSATHSLYQAMPLKTYSNILLIDCIFPLLKTRFLRNHLITLPKDFWHIVKDCLWISSVTSFLF